jgi:hypothetical protein
MNNIQGTGSMQQVMGMQRPPQASLTDEQKTKINDILSQYDASNVTEDDAKAIFQAFKDAGIRPGPGMRETIEAAGFDAEELREEGMSDSDKQGPPPPPPGGGGQGQSVSVSALKSLQSILSQYDLTNLSSDEESDLITKLNESGLMMGAGNIIDLTA